MQSGKLLVKYIYVIMLLGIFYSPACASSTRLITFHINGINTKKDEAYNSMRKLHDIASISYKPITWTLLYNESHGLLWSDIFDVLRQKRQESSGLDIATFVDAYMQIHHIYYERNSPEYNKLLYQIKGLYEQDLNYVGINFSDILGQYHESVASIGKSIMASLTDKENNTHHMALFVSHSQGGLYTNSLIKYITDTEKFPKELVGVYEIATPATAYAPDNNFDDEPYIGYFITANNDYIINALSFLSSILPQTKAPRYANIHLNNCGDMFCHGLVTSYLADKDSVKMINRYINTIVWKLKQQLEEDDE